MQLRPNARMELADKKQETLTVRASASLRSALKNVAEDLDITISKLVGDSLQNIFLNKDKRCAQGTHPFESAVARLYALAKEICSDGILTPVEQQRFIKEWIEVGHKISHEVHEEHDQKEEVA